MTPGSPAAWGRPQTRGQAAFALMLPIVGSILTVAAIVVGNGNLLTALAPVALFAGLALFWVVPIRVALLCFVFLSLSIDSNKEGPWNSPLAGVGSLLHTNIAKVIPGSGIPLQGLTIGLIGLLLLHVHRSVTGTRTDEERRQEPATILLQSFGISLLAVLVMCLIGRLGGGDMKMAKIQVQTFIQVLLVGYLGAVTFRGMRDYRTLGIIVIAAACIKALIAMYVVRVLGFDVPGDAQYATAHGDSLVFAVASVLLLVRVAERPDIRTALPCIFLLPIIAIGMIDNDRRLVWVEVLAALLTFWAISRRSQVKRALATIALLTLPLQFGYVAAGWNSSSEVFAPVRTLRSVQDSNVDSSTMYRDLENFNLLQTSRTALFMGTGFGQPFVEVVTLPNISFFEEYRYMPHNSALGLWAFCGPFGFTGLTFGLVVAIYLAARSYERARTADERVAAFMVVATIIIYMVHCWGDIGFSERRSIYLVGPVLAIAGQLAIATGAWRNRTLRLR